MTIREAFPVWIAAERHVDEIQDTITTEKIAAGKLSGELDLAVRKARQQLADAQRNIGPYADAVAKAQAAVETAQTALTQMQEKYDLRQEFLRAELADAQQESEKARQACKEARG